MAEMRPVNKKYKMCREEKIASSMLTHAKKHKKRHPFDRAIVIFQSSDTIVAMTGGFTKGQEAEIARLYSHCLKDLVETNNLGKVEVIPMNFPFPTTDEDDPPLH